MKFPRTSLLRAVLAAVVAGVAARLTWLGITEVFDDQQSKMISLLLLGCACLVDAVIFLLLARVLRIEEANELVAVVARRVPGLSRR